MQFDPETFGVAMADLVRSAVAPLKAEIADLRKQLDVATAEGQELRQMIADTPEPKDGKDADEGAIVTKVAAAVKADLAQWNGKSVTIEDVRPMIEAEVKARVAEIPVPADGKSIDPADVERMVHEAVAKIPPAANGKDPDPAEIKRLVDEAVAAVPAPKDGKSITVDDVRPILDGALKDLANEARASIGDLVKTAVAAIPPATNGKDGIGLAGFLIDRDGCLIATTTAGEAKNLGPVIGKDGLSLESFTMEYVSDTHEIVLKASAAGRTEEVRYPAGGIRGKGYWREGFKAKAGDAWTHEGSLWVAMKDTETKPGADQSAWFMAARHGKDGETVIKKVRSGPQPPIKLDDSDKREE